MKFSSDFVSTLKNFSGINSGLVLKPGKIQRTMTADKTVIASSEFADEIPVEFGIYDLSQFLGNISNLDDPDITFEGNSIIMKDKFIRVVFFGTSPKNIIAPPDKDLVLKTVDVSFQLQKNILQKMLSLASLNDFSHISLEGKSGKLNLVALDKKNANANSATFEIGEFKGKDFVASFKISNLLMQPDDYMVELMIGGFAKFVSTTKKMVYFVSIESEKGK